MMKNEDLKRLNELLKKYEDIPDGQFTVKGEELRELTKLTREMGVVMETNRIGKDKAVAEKEEAELELSSLRDTSQGKLRELAKRVREMDREREPDPLNVVVWADDDKLYYRASEGDRPDEFYDAIGDIPKVFLKGALIDYEGLEDDDDWVTKRQQHFLSMAEALGGPPEFTDTEEPNEDDPFEESENGGD